jgi:hypothetical protein
MSRKYVLRITRKHGATTQHTGTLKQILKTQVGAPAPYSRHVDEDDLLDTPCGAYQWFIDHPTIPPEVRGCLSSHELETWWDDEQGTYVILHEEPMPITPEGVAAYTEWCEQQRMKNSVGLRVEISPVG